MAKSILSALLGKAISEGHIKSLDQPVKDFLLQLKGPYAEVVTMGDLSSMSSGLNWDEDYDAPLSLIADAYYTSDLKSLVLDQPINTIPGKAFIYKSGATQLSGMAMENALDQKLNRYLNKSFWQELGAEKEALWQVDSKKRGTEKFLYCFASNARDFAHFGKLYKNHGR
jgi:CubicO group peptidase (beta-lactamase class C family)